MVKKQWIFRWRYRSSSKFPIYVKYWNFMGNEIFIPEWQPKEQRINSRTNTLSETVKIVRFSFKSLITHTMIK